jgi:SAM-dependent methyltransferase
MNNPECYSDREASTLDVSSRTFKAQKILAVIQAYLKSKDFLTARCLDIGSSGGIITNFLGKSFSQVVGLDVDVKAIQFAKSFNDRANVSFLIGTGCEVPFESEQFDFVVCNHVYEHVPDAGALFGEIYRILKPKGICYLACSNKYWLIEPHYKLPFLSWIPKSLANAYLRFLSLGGDYEENLLSRNNIFKLLDKFTVTEYTLEILKSPDYFHADDVLRQWKVACYVPQFLAKTFLFWMPNFVWVLEKNRED